MTFLTLALVGLHIYPREFCTFQGCGRAPVPVSWAGFFPLHLHSRYLKYYLLFCNSRIAIRNAGKETYQFQDHCSISLGFLSLTLALHFFSTFVESRLITSLPLFPLLWRSLIFLPPAASSSPLYLSSPPPHMSVCSKLEQRLNRGSETWREFLKRPRLCGTDTNTHAQKHTHSAWQPINSLRSQAKGITACWWAGSCTRVCLCVRVCLWWAGGRQNHLHR